MRKRPYPFSVIISFLAFLHSANVAAEHPSKDSKGRVSRAERWGEWKLARKVPSELQETPEALRDAGQDSVVVVNDVSRLNPVHASNLVHVREISDIQEAVRIAREKGLNISIAGKRHSQGGHIGYDRAVVLDMLTFNKIVALDREQKVITVQSGATWEQIQEYINPYGLAIKVMQASNIFTVGGSLGSNVHGDDPRFGPLIETVKSFRLLTADGSILHVSRTEHPELFRLAIGGFGLFGVILDVELELTDNDIYQGTSIVMDYQTYPEYFVKHIKQDPSVVIHSAKLSIAPESLLREIVLTTFKKTDEKLKGITGLQSEQHVGRNRFLFALSRSSRWGKSVRWMLQKRLEMKVGQTQLACRNNVMRPIIKFLEYHSAKDTDILQEYFVPVENFVGFVDGLRDIIKKDGVNLTSVTVRYVPQQNEAQLAYAKRDSLAVVLYINQKLSQEGIEKAEMWTRKLVDLALREGGTYYLTYQLYPTLTQIRQAYPRINFFFQEKRTYDPKGLFMNKFYGKYADILNAPKNAS